MLFRSKFYKEGLELPNVGREGHTYLSHIVQHYQDLPEIIGFIQADGTENNVCHQENIINTINNLDTNFINPIYFGRSHTCDLNGHPDHARLNIKKYISLFDINIDDNFVVKFCSGAQFIVKKQHILFRPQAFYQYLLDLLSHSVDPIEGYIIERLWGYIFNTDIKLL